MSALEELQARTDLACQRTDPTVFFPEGRYAAAMRMKAQRVCASCPAIAQCAEVADTLTEPHGIWAGVEYRAKWERQAAA